MLAFIIWLIGWFVSYAILSRTASVLITSPKEWDNTDRAFCAGFSLLSWVTVIFCLHVLAYRKIKKYKVVPKWVIPFLKKLEPKGLSRE